MLHGSNVAATVMTNAQHIAIADKPDNNYFWAYNFNDNYFIVYHHGLFFNSCTNIYLKIAPLLHQW